MAENKECQLGRTIQMINPLKCAMLKTLSELFRNLHTQLRINLFFWRLRGIKRCTFKVGRNIRL